MQNLPVLKTREFALVLPVLPGREIMSGSMCPGVIYFQPLRYRQEGVPSNSAGHGPPKSQEYELSDDGRPSRTLTTV
jgi:hypothetical protein